MMGALNTNNIYRGPTLEIESGTTDLKSFVHNFDR
jgi:hypothetical protein